jgi:hypothetical protein
MPENQETQDTAGKFVLTQEAWNSLKVGDVITVELPKEGVSSTTLLQREDNFTTLSMFSKDVPCSATLIKCRFSHNHQCLVDIEDEPIDYLRNIIDIEAETGKKAAEVYANRLTNVSQMDENQYQDIAAGLETQNKAISEIMQDSTFDTFPKKASLILDVIFGKGNYTDKHMCCLAIFMMFYEHQLIKKNRDMEKMQMQIHLSSLLNSSGIGPGMMGMRMMDMRMMDDDESSLSDLFEKSNLDPSDLTGCDGDCENCPDNPGK